MSNWKEPPRFTPEQALKMPEAVLVAKYRAELANLRDSRFCHLTRGRCSTQGPDEATFMVLYDEMTRRVLPTDAQEIPGSFRFQGPPV